MANQPITHPLTICLSLLLAVAACSPGSRRSEPDPSRSWKADISEIEGVRIVSTTDGSVWEGEARLIEEASIGGVDVDEAYQLLQPSGFSVDLRRQRIGISDLRIPAVKIFDFEGNHLFDVGRKGEGPGEYRLIIGMYMDETDGRIFVHLYMNHWINIYDADGTYLDRWRYEMRRGQGAMYFKQSTEGLLRIQHIEQNLATNTWIQKVISYNLDGTAVDTLQYPELDFDTPMVESVTGSTVVPFSPYFVSDINAGGDLVWGYGDSYTLHICNRSGVEIQAEKYWDKVPVLPGEAAWEKQSVTEWLRTREPSWDWNGPPVPAHKPAFAFIHADQSGRIWVQSDGTSTLRSDMVEATEEELAAEEYSPWHSIPRLDVFDSDGRYLGPVSYSETGVESFYIQYARGNVVLAQVNDADDVPSVKRYRLVLPD
ncbi:6-bladed beta-propeller [Gemmatimonadota bacterium]